MRELPGIHRFERALEHKNSSGLSIALATVVTEERTDANRISANYEQCARGHFLVTAAARSTSDGSRFVAANCRIWWNESGLMNSTQHFPLLDATWFHRAGRRINAGPGR